MCSGVPIPSAHVLPRYVGLFLSTRGKEVLTVSDAEARWGLLKESRMENDIFERQRLHRWGGARPGAGRKSRPPMFLHREEMATIQSDTEYALHLLVETMRDETFDLVTRMDAAEELLNRMLGKPAQMTRPAEKDEYKQYLEEIARAVRDANLERPDADGETALANDDDTVFDTDGLTP
jgi:hypothetical protein